MSDQPRIEHEDEPVDEKLTQIVSYLDGELEDTQMNEIEQALFQDPDLRARAESLSRTWALLDALDEVPVSRQFTQDTLATVAADVVSQEQLTGVPILVLLSRLVTRYQVLPWFIVGVMGAGMGLLVARLSQPDSAASAEARILETAVRNIELLNRLELYDLVPSVSALQQIDSGSGSAAPKKQEPAK